MRLKTTTAIVAGLAAFAMTAPAQAATPVTRCPNASVGVGYVKASDGSYLYESEPMTNVELHGPLLVGGRYGVRLTCENVDAVAMAGGNWLDSRLHRTPMWTPYVTAEPTLTVDIMNGKTFTDAGGNERDVVVPTIWGSNLGPTNSQQPYGAYVGYAIERGATQWATHLPVEWVTWVFGEPTYH